MPQQKNIAYIDRNSRGFDDSRHLLDMYWPAVQENCPVLVFIHGGTWISGSKDLYTELGQNFASKGIAVAIINYRLGDKATYNEMAEDCAAAVKWVQDNAKKYHGDPARIVVCGHSAGAHLSALITLDNDYFKKLGTPNPVKACLLIDAFGLNVDTFIRSPLAQMYRQYIIRIFTDDQQQWKKASPVSHVHSGQVPFFIVTGSQSYPVLIEDNRIFMQKLKQVNADVTYDEIPGKNHSEMIRQLQQVNNTLYNKMIDFIKQKAK